MDKKETLNKLETLLIHKSFNYKPEHTFTEKEQIQILESALLYMKGIKK